MTLTFVPKIIVIFVAALTAPFVGAQINSFTLLAYSRIEKDSSGLNLTFGSRLNEMLFQTSNSKNPLDT